MATTKHYREAHAALVKAFGIPENPDERSRSQWQNLSMISNVMEQAAQLVSEGADPEHVAAFASFVDTLAVGNARENARQDEMFAAMEKREAR